MDITLAIISFLVAFAIRYWVARRRFNRRAITGMQLFSNFEASWITTGIERFLMLISIALILLGCFFTLAYLGRRNMMKHQTVEEQSIK